MSSTTKIIYGLLFVLLIIHPHFITGHVFYVSQAFAQSLATLVIIGIAVVVYLLHHRDIRKRELEKHQFETELQISSTKLSEAYEYIGEVNNRLPLLTNVTTNLLNQTKRNKKGKKEILETLLATATVSLAHSSWGIFRFIEIEKERTVKEFVYTTKNYVLLKSKIGNNKLLKYERQNDGIIKIDGLFVLPTSDREALVQCFFIFSNGDKKVKDKLSTLQAIVDQAQLLHKYLYEQTSREYRK